jgi:lysozyme
MIKIIDISYWQQNIDYGTLSQNIDGVILRAAYGTMQDKMVETHYTEFAKRGVPIGFYHYVVEYKSPQAQGETFLNTVSKLEAELEPLGRLGYWCDVELEKNAPPLTRKTVDQYVAYVEDSGITLDFYSSRYYWDIIMKTDAYSDRKFWVAHYGAVSPLMPATGGWKNWWLWQHTHKGRVNGYHSDLDMNHFWGDYSDFNNWVGEDIVVPTPDPEEHLFEVEVTASYLNIRAGAGTQHEIVGLLSNGDKRTVYREYAGWLKIPEGWISGAYTIKVEKPPVVELTLEQRVDRLEKAVFTN